VDHGEFLRREGNTDIKEVVKVARNWRTARLDEQEYAMLEFCEKLTLRQSEMTAQDVQRLRDVGFDDDQILAIVLATSYRNFITRVSDALGVELDPLPYDPELVAVFDEYHDRVHGPDSK
jgi:uncharacterized peroxidase-related enzyme